CIVVVVMALGFSADFLARRIPFSYEQALVSSYPGSVPETHPVDAVLQPLAGRIVEAMDLPDDMTITVHYQDSEIVNAAATFGGHIILYRGLVSRLPNENALAMVMAHEIAHIKHRHPIRSLGRVAMVWLSVMALVGIEGGDSASSVINDAGGLTLLTFSRAQEQEADREALAAVNKLYGHTAGALDLYAVLLEPSSESVGELPAFMSTHPLTLDRIRELKAMQRDLGWSASGTTQPLPVGLNRP
ncbi:MAG: M48 family metallopeptidase, partial [Gammaproteobacteria bacterium]|nr:M48 family metallopeptidase [Gammaproteobacteria bacterium]